MKSVEDDDWDVNERLGGRKDGRDEKQRGVKKIDPEKKYAL